MAAAKETKPGLYTEDTYEVELPISKENQSDVTVGINGKVYRIQRGKKVKVPAAVYEVLMNSMKMDNLAIQRSLEMQKQD